MSLIPSFQHSKIPSFIPIFSQRDAYGTTGAFHSSTFPQNSKHTIIILHSNICFHNADILVTVKAKILIKPLIMQQKITFSVSSSKVIIYGIT